MGCFRPQTFWTRPRDYVCNMYTSDTVRSGLWVETEEHTFFDPDKPINVDVTYYHGRHQHLAISRSAAVQLDNLGRPDIVITVVHPFFMRRSAAYGSTMRLGWPTSLPSGRPTLSPSVKVVWYRATTQASP